MGRNPGVTLEWGAGFEGRKAAPARSKVRKSLDIAKDAMSTLDVSTSGRRIIFVQTPMAQKTKKNIVGEALPPDRIWLYSDAANLEREDFSKVVYDASTLIHEDFHLERMKWFDYDGVLETAYAEGLSYYSEYMLASLDESFAELGGPVPAVLERSPMDIEMFGEKFFKALAAKHTAPATDVDWLKQPDNSVLSRAEQIGVYIVHNHFLCGADFPDLLPLAAEECIGQL